MGGEQAVRPPRRPDVEQTPQIRRLRSALGSRRRKTAGTLLWGAEAIRPARDAARRMNFNHRTGEPYIPVPENVTKRHWRSDKTFAQIHDPLG